MPKIPEFPDLPDPGPDLPTTTGKSAPVDQDTVRGTETVIVDEESGKVKDRKSKREEMQDQNRGTKDLQIPLNEGEASGESTNVQD